MASRFYFTNSVAAVVSPTINAGGEWEHAQSVRRAFRKTLGSDALGNSNSYTPDGSDHLVDGDAMVAQWVCSDPLAAQSIAAQTVKWQFQCFESNAGNNLALTIKIFVCSADGSTIKETLLAIRRDGAEMNTSLRNISDSATISSADVEDGDRLVIELGGGGTPTAAGGVQGHNLTIRAGENASSGDLPENDTETGTTFRPWLEFANTLTFLEATGTTSKALPLGGSINADNPIAAASTKALPLAGSAAAINLVSATTSKALPLAGTASGTVEDSEVTGDSDEALPLSGAASGAVGVVGQSTRSLGLAGTSTVSVAVDASSIKALPLGGLIEVDIIEPVVATSERSLPLSGAASSTVLVTGVSNKALPLGGAGRAVQLGPVRFAQEWLEPVPTRQVNERVVAKSLESRIGTRCLNP